MWKSRVSRFGLCAVCALEDFGLAGWCSLSLGRGRRIKRRIMPELAATAPPIPFWFYRVVAGATEEPWGQLRRRRASNSMVRGRVRPLYPFRARARRSRAARRIRDELAGAACDFLFGKLVGGGGGGRGARARGSASSAPRLQQTDMEGMYEAYFLLTLAGRLRVGNMVDPKYSLGASILKRYLPR